jgi:excisionase family DNA binding protein
MLMEVRLSHESHRREVGEVKPRGVRGGAVRLPIRQVEVMEPIDSTSRNFFTERTLAAFLAVSDRTVRDWIRRGHLPSYKLGGSRRIDPADVEAFLAARREAGRRQ